MIRKRIVVTGMGIVSPYGTDIDLFYQQLLQGKSCIRLIDTFPCEDYPTRIGGIIRDFDIGDYMQKKQARRVDPFIRYAIVAAKKALNSAKFDPNVFDKKRVGVLIGSGMGGMGSFYDGVETVITKGYRRLTPFFVPIIITNMAGALLAIDFDFQGPNYSISTACATSNYAILSAAEEIQLDHVDMMVCGGTEAPMNPIGLAGFVAAHVLSTRNDEPEKASRPWDRGRDGFVMGEGAGILILEELEHAKRRNAPIFAEFLGGAKNCDAYHMTDPREDGSVVADCMREALENANITKEKIDYINAHATATIVGDVCELVAMKQVFQDHLKHIKINATKSLIGHCLGAAGGIEAIATLQAIRTGKLHPTLNLEDPIEELRGIDAVPLHAIDHKVEIALSNSFGFGGHNSSLVFSSYRG